MQRWHDNALSGLTFGLLDDICAATNASDDARRLLQQMQDGELGEPWCLDDSLLLHNSRIFIIEHCELCH
jgi:hypothetical protein